MGSHREAQETAEVVAVACALTPYIANYDAKGAPPTNRRWRVFSHASLPDRRGVFSQDDLFELNNIFSLFMCTCLNPSHIRASFCIDVDGIRPLVFTSTNQGVFGESAKQLLQCSDRIQSICRLLATITADSGFAVRHQILELFTRDAWPKIGHKFGLVYKDKCSLEFNKDVNPPAYFPARVEHYLNTIVAKTGNRHADLIRAMADLVKLLLRCFEGEGAAPSIAERGHDKRPNEADVKPDDWVTALLATYQFYHMHGEYLAEVLKGNSEAMSEMDGVFIKRFKNIAQYVEAVHFLCNLAFGQTPSGRAPRPWSRASSGDRIRTWFRTVEVRPYELPEAAFFRDGQKHTGVPSVPTSPTVPSASSELPPSDTPDAPSSPTDSASFTAGAGHAPPLGALMGKHGLQRRYDSRTWRPAVTGKDHKKIADFATVYNSASGCGGKQPPMIHAEVALLYAIAELKMEYPVQLGGPTAPPIYIASFKKACYCCRILMRESGMNVVMPQSHTTIYPSWRLADREYLDTAVPSAACWASKFHEAMGGIMREALRTTKRRSMAGERVSSEDLELQTFASISRNAYSSDSWREPPPLRAAALPVPSSPNVTDAEQNSARRQRPLSGTRSNAHRKRRKRH